MKTKPNKKNTEARKRKRLMSEPNTLIHQFLDNEEKDKTREKKDKAKKKAKGKKKGNAGLALKEKITRRKEDKGRKKG